MSSVCRVNLHACCRRLAANPSRPSNSSVLTKSQYVAWHDLVPVKMAVPKRSNLKYPIKFGAYKATWDTRRKLSLSECDIELAQRSNAPPWMFACCCHVIKAIVGISNSQDRRRCEGML